MLLGSAFPIVTCSCQKKCRESSRSRADGGFEVESRLPGLMHVVLEHCSDASRPRAGQSVRLRSGHLLSVRGGATLFKTLDD